MPIANERGRGLILRMSERQTIARPTLEPPSWKRNLNRAPGAYRLISSVLRNGCRGNRPISFSAALPPLRANFLDDDKVNESQLASTLSLPPSTPLSAAAVHQLWLLLIAPDQYEQSCPMKNARHSFFCRPSVAVTRY